MKEIQNMSDSELVEFSTYGKRVTRMLSNITGFVENKTSFEINTTNEGAVIVENKEDYDNIKIKKIKYDLYKNSIDNISSDKEQISRGLNEIVKHQDKLSDEIRNIQDRKMDKLVSDVKSYNTEFEKKMEKEFISIRQFVEMETTKIKTESKKTVGYLEDIRKADIVDVVKDLKIILEQFENIM